MREASIDNELLNDYFVNERFEFELAEKEHLTKHAKRYGYIKIPQHTYLERKDKLAVSRNREFISKKKSIEKQIFENQKFLREILTSMNANGDN